MRLFSSRALFCAVILHAVKAARNPSLTLWQNILPLLTAKKLLSPTGLSETLKLAENVAVGFVAQILPGEQMNIVRDEPHGPIGKNDMHPADMITLGIRIVN